ncbi:MAG: hypothetical protein LBV09_03550 [Deferribacteraceae bacterium]|jgi:flagellin|nr:hypothetical protein [Deferribacteraceae bacterium]
MINIRTNSNAIVAQNSINFTAQSLQKSIERLSTGFRINHADDDPSGLMVSERLRSQINGLTRGTLNAQNTISLLQTAEGAIDVITDMVQRMNEIAIQASDTAITANDRSVMQNEINAIKDQINMISANTEYNTKKLLTGDAAALASSTNSNVTPIVTGMVADGSYKLDFKVTAGENTVYSSNKMMIDSNIHELMLSDNSTPVTGVQDLSRLDTAFNVNVSSASRAATTAVRHFPESGTTYNMTQTVTTTANTRSGYFIIKSDQTIPAIVASATYTVTFVDAATGLEESEQIKFTDLKSANDADRTKTLTIGGGLTITAWQADNLDRIVEGDMSIITVEAARDAIEEIAIQAKPDTTYTAFSTHAVYDTDYGEGTVYSLILDADHEYTIVGAKIMWDTSTEGFGGASAKSPATFKADGRQFVADNNTRLSDIASFTNADGVGILGGTQALTLYSQDKEATIYLDSLDTIETLNEKLTNALIAMGMGAKISDRNAHGINENLVIYNGSATATMGVNGGFVLQSALTGDKSEIFFSGDEDLINALGFTTLKEGRNATITVHTSGKNLSNTTSVRNGVLQGVVQGVDFDISEMNSSTPELNPADSRITFSTSDAPTTVYVDIKDNRRQTQVGANEGQKIDFAIGRMDTKSLGLDDIYVNNPAQAQRAITTTTQALERALKAEASVGAYVMRLQYAIDNNAITRQNLISAQSDIRDTDIAAESSKYIVSQIRMNAATAMLAQANTFPSLAMQLIG